MSDKVGRILWNKRGNDIDEIVLLNVEAVHIEQMSNGCWWIGIDLNNGGWWSGNFNAEGKMGFSEQERDGFEWDRDESHEDYKLKTSS